MASHFSSQIGGHLEDKLFNWRTKCHIKQSFQKEDNWRTNFQIGGHGGQIVILEDVLLIGGPLFLILSASARQLVYPKMLQQLKFFTLGSWILKHQEEDKREWLYSEHHRPWNLFLGSCNHDVTQNDKYNFNSFNIQTFKHCQ